MMDARTVLVVEDDASIRGLVVEILNDAGFVVLQADRGDAGLLLAEEHTPAVVLVNHGLPDMTGLDLLERLRCRESTRRIPVVLVSGRAQQLPNGAAGAERVIPMPFDIDALLMHVEQLAAFSHGAVV
jgi:DNA-binding response OmpR family regulator